MLFLMNGLYLFVDCFHRYGEYERHEFGRKGKSVECCRCEGNCFGTSTITVSVPSAIDFDERSR